MTLKKASRKVSKPQPEIVNTSVFFEPNNEEIIQPLPVEDSYNKILNFNRQNFLQGIIFSEILGKPRGRMNRR